MTIMEDILARIEQRLVETGQKATSASKEAGKPDAIRNIKRAVQKGQQSTVTLETLIALAKQLEVTPQWLLFAEGHDGDGNHAPSGIDVPSILQAVEGTYTMLGMNQEQASALVRIVLAAASEPPTPSSGADYHRVLAEIEARKFLKSKQS